MKPAFVLARSPATLVRAFDLTVGRETVKAELHGDVLWFDDAGTWKIFAAGDDAVRRAVPKCTKCGAEYPTYVDDKGREFCRPCARGGGK